MNNNVDMITSAPASKLVDSDGCGSDWPDYNTIKHAGSITAWRAARDPYDIDKRSIYCGGNWILARRENYHRASYPNEVMCWCGKCLHGNPKLEWVKEPTIKL